MHYQYNIENTAAIWAISSSPYNPSSLPYNRHQNLIIKPNTRQNFIFLIINPTPSSYLPRVSTIGSFLTIASRLAILITPIANVTVTTMGSPSGMAATARLCRRGGESWVGKKIGECYNENDEDEKEEVMRKKK